MNAAGLSQAAGVARQFALIGPVRDVSAYAGGRINDSFLVNCGDEPGERRRYILQRINREVFRDPVALMDNVVRVTRHIARKLPGASRASGRQAVTLVLTRDGRPWFRDDAGGVWRVFPFVENSVALRTPDSPQRVRRAAAAFGDFARMLLDLPPPRLHETIPGFHDTPRRYDALAAAIERDEFRRAADAAEAIEFAMQRRSGAGVLVELERGGVIPGRIAHYDAKLANVLFDAGSGEALCVIDFDTVMPGSVLYDFGDMVRSMACGATESDADDATDGGSGTGGAAAGASDRKLSVDVDLAAFEAIVEGYLEAAGFLTPIEREHLVTAGRIITLEQGVRFLTDHLQGDRYYRPATAGANLAGAAQHFALVSSIERRHAELERIVRRRQARAHR